MNERMTKCDTDGQAMMDCEKCKADWAGKHGKPMADCTALYCRNRLLGRLVEYENTGFEPEEVTALGKLFDYALKESKTLTEQLTLLKPLRELAEADKDGRVVVLPCKVYETDGVRVYEHTVREVIYETAGGPAFDKNAIGKSIFLTRAEAENALQEMEGQEGWQRNEYVTAAGRR